jgi:hypothetical protein
VPVEARNASERSAGAQLAFAPRAGDDDKAYQWRDGVSAVDEFPLVHARARFGEQQHLGGRIGVEELLDGLTERGRRRPHAARIQRIAENRELAIVPRAG